MRIWRQNCILLIRGPRRVLSGYWALPEVRRPLLAVPGIDLWVTTAAPGDQVFHGILSNYADATGHAPVLPDTHTGFWQSEMRYRTADEIVEVAEQYAARKVPLGLSLTPK